MEENIRSVFVVTIYGTGQHQGGLYEIKILQGGKVLGGEGEGLSESPVLHPLTTLFKTEPGFIIFTCARFDCCSKLYLLLDEENNSTTMPPSVDGLVYDAETGSFCSFRRPAAAKKYGVLIYAYSKLYHLACPRCFPQIPKPSFERFDPILDSWEPLPTCPFFSKDMEIVGYVVYHGCILLSLTGPKKYEFIAFNVGTKQWHKVKFPHLNYDKEYYYPFAGKGVVVGDNVYALTLCGSVMKFSFVAETNDVGEIAYSLDVPILLEGLYFVPLFKQNRKSTQCLVHLGDLEFCVVRTRLKVFSLRQHIWISTFRIVNEGGSDVHIKTLHSTVRVLDIRDVFSAFIIFGFTLACEDVETKQGITTLEMNNNSGSTSSVEEEHEKEGRTCEDVETKDWPNKSSGSGYSTNEGQEIEEKLANHIFFN